MNFGGRREVKTNLTSRQARRLNLFFGHEQMFKLINKQIIASNIKRLDIVAPMVVKKFQPGQFVMLGLTPESEKIPLAIADVDAYKDSIALIIKEQGSITQALGQLAIHDSVYSILGPLGTPATVKKVGTVMFVAVGIGIAQILPVCRAYRHIGNKTLGLIGGRNRREIILESQMRIACQKLYLTTEDGSFERRGTPATILRDLVTKEKVDMVYAAGPTEFLHGIAEITRAQSVKTFVQVNPVMLDGTGICGSCRVNVGGKLRLACVEGPEFDAHQIDFNDFKMRHG